MGQVARMAEHEEEGASVKLPTPDAAWKAGLGERIRAAADAHRTELLGLLRQVPSFVEAAKKLTDGGLFRVIVSKENAGLLREGPGGVVKPFLRRNGRFVENVDLMRVPSDISGAIACLALQAALTEVSAKLDRVVTSVDDLSRLVAQANQGSLQGAINALEANHRLRDPAERRMRMLGACGQVIEQIGKMSGQLGAHIQQMPLAETGFFDGWSSDWEVEAEQAYGLVRADFAVIVEGLRRVLAAYCDLGEFDSAHAAFTRVTRDLDAAGLALAEERARLLPYAKVGAAPEQVFAAFIAGWSQAEARLRGMAEGRIPELVSAFSREEIEG